jgi:hypothetical protein
MTKIEALQILNLADDATHEDIQKAYTSQYDDLKTKITNAGTIASLRSKWETKLEELKTAHNTLTMTSPTESTSGLASTTPLEIPTQAQRSDTAPVLEQETSDESEKIKKRFKYLYAGLVLALMALAGMVVMYVNLNKKYEKIAPLEAKVTGLAKIENNVFKLQNAGDKPFHLLKLKTYYYDKDYNLQLFEENIGKNINAGGTYAPLIVQGNQSVYDGKAVFYEVTVMDLESTPECPRYARYSGIIETKQNVLINLTDQE